MATVPRTLGGNNPRIVLMKRVKPEFVFSRHYYPCHANGCGKEASTKFVHAGRYFCSESCRLDYIRTASNPLSPFFQRKQR